MDGEWLAERFEADRARLQAVAYRLLGSASEADDAVQEAWLRLSRADAGEIENLNAWLTTVVARVCLDMLRSRQSRREEPLDWTASRRAGRHRSGARGDAGGIGGSGDAGRAPAPGAGRACRVRAARRLRRALRRHCRHRRALARGDAAACEPGTAAGAGDVGGGPRRGRGAAAGDRRGVFSCLARWRPASIAGGARSGRRAARRRRGVADGLADRFSHATGVAWGGRGGRRSSPARRSPPNWR